MNIKIIHEDQDLLVINKPPGLVVNRAESVKVATLQDWLEDNIEAIGKRKFPDDWQEQLPKDFTDEYGTPEEIFESRTGLAHRLDKETSGVMLLAKHPGSLVNLLKQFRLRETQKKYICLTHGKFALPSGEVNLPLGRRPSNRKLFAVVPDGRSAFTKYKVEKFYPNFNLKKLEQDYLVANNSSPVNSIENNQYFNNNQIENHKKTKLSTLKGTTLKGINTLKGTSTLKGINKKGLSRYDGFSLVSCWPKTGRTHQIRVHMAYLKHSIVGDKSYVGKKRVKIDNLWCKRQFLHAHEIELTHPRSGNRVSYSADLSDDLVGVLDYLE